MRETISMMGARCDVIMDLKKCSGCAARKFVERCNKKCPNLSGPYLVLGFKYGLVGKHPKWVYVLRGDDVKKVKYEKIYNVRP